MHKGRGIGPRIGRWIFMATAVFSGQLCASDAFLSMPSVGDVLTPQTAARQYQSDVVRLAISHFSYPNVNYDIIYPTVRSLQQVFGENRLYVEIVSGEDVDTSRFDLVLGSAGTYRRFTHRGTRDIASLVSDRFPNPNRAEGSVFAVLKTNPASRLEDLCGSRLISTGLQAFSGYHIAMGELLDYGVKPATFFF